MESADDFRLVRGDQVKADLKRNSGVSWILFHGLCGEPIQSFGEWNVAKLDFGKSNHLQLLLDPRWRAFRRNFGARERKRRHGRPPTKAGEISSSPPRDRRLL